MRASATPGFSRAPAGPASALSKVKAMLDPDHVPAPGRPCLDTEEVS